MKALSNLVCLLIALIILASCATIISKSEYPVHFTCSPDQANITVRDANNMVVFTGTTPTTAVLPAGGGYFKGQDYMVTFEKEGYISTTVPIQRSIDGWYIGGNILLGGLIGWLIVDPATGAMWTLTSEVATVLQPLESKLYEEGSIVVTTIDRIPPELHDQMIRIDTE